MSADPKGFRVAMVILALAWGVNFVALAFNYIRIPGTLGDPHAIWDLVATLSAAAGAVVARAFHFFGVVLYTAAALSLIVKAYAVTGATEPMPVGWPYILGLIIFAALIWSEWGRFRRPNA